MTSQLKNNDFGPAGQSIYSFLWDEYADWYIEISKKRMNSDDALAQQQVPVVVLPVGRARRDVAPSLLTEPLLLRSAICCSCRSR